ncbi:SPOR domain-containing protein [Parapedobacter sp. DT-150]|uniref:HU domain-containing protein n=1 Tax=Parapedobacter sp. DT-150 TaxID=3396162 RepID=UPI003F1BD46D
MNLGLCIANLLRRYPAVAVPGIGVFAKRHIPASYHQDTSAFLPPATHIELTDGQQEAFSLITYLQVQRQVDEDTAKQLLERAVDEVMETISRRGQALLDGLGYLLADGASFVLKPFETGGFGWKPVKEQAAPERETPGEEVTATPERATEQVEPAAVLSDEVYVTKSRKAWWIAAAALLVLISAVGVAWYYKAGKSAQTGVAQEQQGGVADPKNRDSGDGPTGQGLPTATDSIAVDSAVVDSLAGGRVLADSATVAPAAKPKPSVTYEIIVGSFNTMAEAKQYVKTMNAKGYDLEALESRMPGNRKKVSWASFTTEEEAYRELKRVQKNFEPTAWIAKIEHN